jgi:outer membrane protein assembly factor BamB
MKRIKYLQVIFIILLSGEEIIAQTPHVKWWFDTHDMSFGNAASGDIDKDGKPEIVFGCYRNDSCVYALNGEDGSLLWKRNTGGCNDVGPTIYDVDGDDSLEVIVPSSCVPETFCLNGATGSIKWHVPTNGSDSPPTIGDVDNDGKPEILHGEFGGYVICLNGEDGSQKWEIPVDLTSWIQTEPALLDLDGNLQLDFVVGNWSDSYNKVYAYRADNHSPLWEQDAPADYMYHGASFADIDMDGKPELVIGSYDGYIYCINGEDGSVKWSATSNSYYPYVGAPTSIADLNNDGNLEVVFVNDEIVAAVSDTGSVIWDYPIPGYATSFRGAAISDINEDGILDVVFGTSDGDVIVLSGIDGSEIWTYDLATLYGNDFEIDHGPVIADFDGNGKLDIFVVGGHAEYPAIENNYGRAYCISSETGTGPDWPMFRRDIVRSACVCDSVTGIENKMPDTKNTVRIYPNPAKDKIHVSAGIKSKGLINIEISDINNTTVFRRTCKSASGKLNLDIDVPCLAPGIYFIIVRSNDFSGAVKFAVIP